MLRSKIVSIVDICTRFPWAIIAIAAIFSVVTALYSISNFSINTNVNRLISQDLDWRYPTVLATTGSCASPHPSYRLQPRPRRQVRQAAGGRRRPARGAHHPRLPDRLAGAPRARRAARAVAGPEQRQRRAHHDRPPARPAAQRGHVQRHGPPARRPALDGVPGRGAALTVRGRYLLALRYFFGLQRFGSLISITPSRSHALGALDQRLDLCEEQ
jgi:hypothetical protein